MSVFADYLDLRTAVIEQSGRPDIADVFDRLTKLAEARFNRSLRTRFQIASEPISISENAAALPDDYVEVIGVYGANGYELTGQTLQRTANVNWRTYYSLTSTEINGPDGDLTLQYYAKVPTLTTSMTASNWLLEKYPDAYLYGVGYEAALYLKDAAGAQASGEILKQIMTDISSDDESARYARAVVRVKGCTP